ncbi:YeeE/YedE family protein [Bacillus massiliigorillae]|uniref:YeeE/YedE family protein n=1 Tax=Bacillus massiliigorillae TaxID=1243664 RepID=UPI00039FE2A3|nr:YeeE/YedE family protein [Bacillus massiliigorillae]
MAQMIITGIICGILLGFVLQRGRFCIVGAYRDLILARDGRMFLATFIVIAIQSVGVFLLWDTGNLVLETGLFPWLGTIVGGLIFGVGMVLAGGCATGTWYRAGEGLIGSWIALFGYMLGSAMTKFGVLLPVADELTSYKASDAYVFETLGISKWYLVVLLVGIVGALVIRELRKPKLFVARLKPKKTGLSHVLFEKAWHPFVTAALVGLIAIIAWPLSEATGRNAGLGITTPTAKTLQFLVTGDNALLDWGVFLVLGIFIGSFIAAKGSGEFRFRLPDKATLRNNAIGGLVMGFGASIAGGCTIGNGLVNSAIFAWQGWVAMACFLLGSWIAVYFTIIRKNKKSKAGSSTKVSA